MRIHAEAQRAGLTFGPRTLDFPCEAGWHQKLLNPVTKEFSEEESPGEVRKRLWPRRPMSRRAVTKVDSGGRENNGEVREARTLWKGAPAKPSG